jgi:solute carrier family 8 (sodium/calcium exchanger)
MPEDAFDWEQKCVVTILDDDLPGVLSWSKQQYYVAEGEAYIVVGINRRRGALGEVSTYVRTVKGDSAVAGEDFMPIDEKVVLEQGQAEAKVHIPLPMSRQDNLCQFEVEMYAPGGCVSYSKNGEKCTVVLGETEEQSEYMNKAADLLNSALEGGRGVERSYTEQLCNAFLVMGGDDDAGPATWQDWLYHLITIFWKVVYAANPPPQWGDGYPCFFSSLVMIGLTTWAVSDVANIWACVVGIPKSCAAITVVALGTSLPDTFASKSAAENDPTADASITNVTGSNSVNVFLGLGLPWTMAAIYWASIGCEFRVEAQTLWLAVLLFSFNAIVCVVVLYLRRWLLGGELGGPKMSKYLSAGFLTALWFEYIIVACLMV